MSEGWKLTLVFVGLTVGSVTINVLLQVFVLHNHMHWERIFP